MLRAVTFHALLLGVARNTGAAACCHYGAQHVRIVQAPSNRRHAIQLLVWCALPHLKAGEQRVDVREHMCPTAQSRMQAHVCTHVPPGTCVCLHILGLATCPVQGTPTLWRSWACLRIRTTSTSSKSCAQAATCSGTAGSPLLVRGVWGPRAPRLAAELPAVWAFQKSQILPFCMLCVPVSSGPAAALCCFAAVEHAPVGPFLC